MKVLHCGNRNLYLFSCDLDLDAMTFIYELDPYSLKIYRMCKYELSTLGQGFQMLSLTDRQTDRQRDTTKIITTPLRGWSITSFC